MTRTPTLTAVCLDQAPDARISRSTLGSRWLPSAVPGPKKHHATETEAASRRLLVLAPTVVPHPYMVPYKSHERNLSPTLQKGSLKVRGEENHPRFYLTEKSIRPSLRFYVQGF